ncbi:MAG: hypothetical protein KGI58_03840, partial [Patescibacteria group bacterium]|nr:hypothetical protein [Patescibacteria group bacterium]
PTPTTGSIEITKYSCPEGTSVTRSSNGVGGTIPNGCTPEVGKTFGYVHGDQTDTNAPYPELSAPLTAAGSTDASGVLSINDLSSSGRYLVVETDANNQQLPASDVLGLYCEGDGDTSSTNDNQELTFVPAGGVAHCVVYDQASVVTPTNVTVHIFKYIDGVQATTQSANGVDFPMFTSTYNAPFTLGPAGWTTGDIAYEASTAPMPVGSSYTANENLDTSLVGSSCDGSHQYSLDGYRVGDTLTQAKQSETSLTIPNFTNLQGDKYILVKNHKCPDQSNTTGSIEITKYVCPQGTVVLRNTNGVGMTVPQGCVLQDGKTFGYVPYPEFGNSPLIAGGSTVNGILTISNLLATSDPYLVAETDANNQQLPASDVLGLYCEGDGDTSNTNDNQEITYVPAGGVAHCVAYDQTQTPANNPEIVNTTSVDENEDNNNPSNNENEPAPNPTNVRRGGNGFPITL